jgi:hypothetical protein
MMKVLGLLSPAVAGEARPSWRFALASESKGYPDRLSAQGLEGV